MRSAGGSAAAPHKSMSVFLHAAFVHAFVAPPPTNNSYCEACELVAGGLLTHGCGWAKGGCKTLPPLEHELCEWLVTASLCPYLVSHFNSSLAACTDLGLCGSECECGVCTKSSLGPNGRCLGAPNSCGHPRRIVSPFESAPLIGHCFDGQCDQPASVGCCLTCY